METLMQWLLVIIPIFPFLCAGAVLIYQWMKGKISTRELFKELCEIAERVVLAVEQKYPNMRGTEKYVRAAREIAEIAGRKPTEQELNTAIESGVYIMNTSPRVLASRALTRQGPITGEQRPVPKSPWL